MKKMVSLLILLSVFALANTESNDVRSVRKHASDFLGITKDTEPPYDIFKDLVIHTNRYRRLVGVFMSLADTNDLEDVVGIEYLEKFYSYYCPISPNEHFDSRSPLEQVAIEELFRFPQTVFLEAKKIAGCFYPKP